MKKITAFILVLTIMLTPVMVFADEITVYIDGNKLEFDVQPQIIGDRTMVPMRVIFESLGAVVSWDADTRTATGKKGDTVVNISIDSTTLFKNGEPKALDVPPLLIDSRTLVPVRAIAESFDCNVDWISQERKVVITTNGSEGTDHTKLSATEISEKASKSVFYIEIYDANKRVLGSGSGFFVTSDGVAVTNYHVIEGTASAQITTTSGEKYAVSDVIAFDEELDVAIIRVSKKSVSGNTVANFPALKMADSDKIKAGQNIYAIGSPVGLQNTISNGIISNVNQKVDDETFIQITAPISHGSSGGALVDEYGEVLGITSAGIEDAQNIGFAIPINIIKQFDLNAEGMPYGDFAKEDNSFILELSQESVTIKAGQTVEVLIFAEGKNDDWSIYWDTEDTDIVDCEWGDWLKENDSICPLYITGLREGYADITIYSDVDFKGKHIAVYVEESIQMYKSSAVNVPTYTYVTGDQPLDFKQYERNDLYVYDYYDIDVVQSYVDYLFDCGFTYYKEEEESDLIAYYYRTPEGPLISVVLAHRWREVWIYIPRY